MKKSFITSGPDLGLHGLSRPICHYTYFQPFMVPFLTQDLKPYYEISRQRSEFNKNPEFSVS